MDELINIKENEGRQTVSARELYRALGLDSTHWNRWAKQNIEDNQFAIPGQDYEGFAIMANGNKTQDYQLSIDFAKRLCMLARTEKGEKIRNYFIEVEKRFQTITSELSPQLQVLINLELKTKQLESRTENVERSLSLVKDTLIQQDPDWRKWINQMFNRIVRAVGNDEYQKIRANTYNLLEVRGHCNLDTRLKNLKQRLEDTGATKTKVNNINKIDVIESEPKLKEIYTTIIKEMTIKYVA